MVSLDRVNNVAAFLEFLSAFYADLYVRALNVVGERLTNIVEKSRAARKISVDTKLVCHHSREESNLDGVTKNVLSVAETVTETSEETNELVVDSVDSDLKGRSLTRLLNGGVNLSLCLFNHLLDSRGMDSAVGDKLFKSKSCDLSLYGIKSRNGDSLGCVVDDKINAGERFDLLNVSSLATDDTSLHVLARKLYYRDSGLCDVVCRATLDCERYNVLCLFVRFFLEFLLKLDHSCGELVAGLLLDLGEDLLLCNLGAVSRDLLKSLQLDLHDLVDLLLDSVVFAKLLVELLVLLFKLLGLLVKVLFLLSETSFKSCHLGASFLEIALGFVSLTKDLFLSLDQRFLFHRSRLLFGIGKYRFCLALGGADLSLCKSLTKDHSDEYTDR